MSFDRMNGKPIAVFVVKLEGNHGLASGLYYSFILLEFLIDNFTNNIVINNGIYYL